MVIKFKHMFTDSGFCRAQFKTRNSKNQWIYYCLMEDGDKIRLFRTGKGPHYEPEYPVNIIKPEAELNFEMPNDGYGESLVNRFKEGK